MEITFSLAALFLVLGRFNSLVSGFFGLFVGPTWHPISPFTEISNFHLKGNSLIVALHLAICTRMIHRDGFFFQSSPSVATRNKKFPGGRVPYTILHVGCVSHLGHLNNIFFHLPLLKCWISRLETGGVAFWWRTINRTSASVVWTSRCYRTMF